MEKEIRDAVYKLIEHQHTRLRTISKDMLDNLNNRNKLNILLIELYKAMVEHFKTEEDYMIYRVH